MFLRERRDDENTVGPHTADARATDGRLACRPRHAPMRPRRMGLRRSDGTPCPGHPLDPSKSDRYAGRFPGSRVVAPVTPSQPGRTPMPVAACPFLGQACVRHSPLTVAGTAADSKRRFSPHSHLRPCRAPTRSDGPVEPGLPRAYRHSGGLPIEEKDRIHPPALPIPGCDSCRSMAPTGGRVCHISMTAMPFRGTRDR